MLRCRAWGVLARLLPNAGHLLLPSRLDLREGTHRISLAVRKWSDHVPAQVVRPVAWLDMDQTGYHGRGGLKACVTSILRWGSTPSGRTGPCLRGCSEGCARRGGGSRRVGGEPRLRLRAAPARQRTRGRLQLQDGLGAVCAEQLWKEHAHSISEVRRWRNAAMHAGPCGACSRLREPGNARQGRVLVVVSVRPAGCHLRFERRDCRGARGEHRLGWSAIQSHRADEPHECRPPLALAQLVQCSVLGAAAVQQRDKMRGLESARVCAMQWRVLTAGWGLPCATESQACVCAAWTHSVREAQNAKRQWMDGWQV